MDIIRENSTHPQARTGVMRRLTYKEAMRIKAEADALAQMVRKAMKK